MKKQKQKLLLNKLYRRNKNIYKIISLDLQADTVKFQNVLKPEIIETEMIEKFILRYQEASL